MSGFVQELGVAGSSATGTSLVVTNSGAATTIGDDVIVIFTTSAAPGTVSASDSAGNTGVVDEPETVTTPFTYLIRIHQAASLANGGTLTISNTSTSGGRAATASEYSTLTGSPLDQVGANNTASGTTHTTTAGGANGQASELVICGYGLAGAVTALASTGYTVRTPGVSTGTIRTAVLADKVVSGIETSSGTLTWTTAVASSGVIATYKLSAGGAPVLHLLPMLGVGS